MKIASPDAEAVKDEAQDDLLPFFYLKDLVGRHVIIVPREIETEDDKFNPGTQQEKVTADVLVLDGRKTRATDERNVFPTLPRFQRGIWLRGSRVVPALRKFVGTGEPVLAFVQKPEQAYELVDADPDVQKAVLEGQYDEFLEDSQTQAQDPPF